MAWDIHGNQLRKGYCEVHPHIGEEYPCSLCQMEIDRDNNRRRSEHLENICSDEIEALQKKANEVGFKAIIIFEKL